jgi:hypothetical protein
MKKLLLMLPFLLLWSHAQAQVTNTGLPSATMANGTDIIAADQGTCPGSPCTTRGVTGAQLSSFVWNTPPTIGNASALGGTETLPCVQSVVLVYCTPAQIATYLKGSGNIPQTVGITIDGGGIVPSTGVKGYYRVKYAGTITGVSVIADQSGSCVLNVKKSTTGSFPSTTSIVASDPPTLSSAQISLDTTLTGWTTTVNAGDVLEFDLTSASTVTRITLEVYIG